MSAPVFWMAVRAANIPVLAEHCDRQSWYTLARDESGQLQHSVDEGEIAVGTAVDLLVDTLEGNGRTKWCDACGRPAGCTKIVFNDIRACCRCNSPAGTPCEDCHTSKDDKHDQ